MDGATYPVSETLPTGGRRLETTPDAPMAALVTGRQLAKHHDEERRLFGGALMTSGSFTMMAGGGMGRRELTEEDAGAERLETTPDAAMTGRRNMWTGALMTSGSFTMMAASSP